MMPVNVLLVDDEEYILNSIQRLFIDYSGINIIKAANADKALVYLKENETAVIVSDYMMPGTKGVELLCKLKDISPDTFKILMTAHADLSIAIDAINNGEVNKILLKPWDDEKLKTIITEGIKSYEIRQSLKKSDEAALLSLADAIELKDNYTKGHCQRVAEYALKIALKLKLTEEEIKFIKYGAWLHDCGKIGVPEDILNHNGPLNHKKWEIMRKHPEWGLKITSHANLALISKNIIKFHHERCNGQGYPEGLKDIDIPLEAKLVAIADTYDAITTDRPYRKAYSFEEGRLMLSSLKGELLDPKLVDIFLSFY